MRRSILLTANRKRKPMFMVLRPNNVHLSRGLVDNIGGKVTFVEDDDMPGVVYLDTNSANVDALTVCTKQAAARILKPSALIHALRERGFPLDTRLVVTKENNELVLRYMTEIQS